APPFNEFTVDAENWSIWAPRVTAPAAAVDINAAAAAQSVDRTSFEFLMVTLPETMTSGRIAARTTANRRPRPRFECLPEGRANLGDARVRCTLGCEGLRR